MTIYYAGQERPKDAASWERPMSEVYEPPYTKPVQRKEPDKPDQKQRKWTSFERSFQRGMGLDV